MQPASSARLPDGFMAAIWLGAEKAHQGVSTQNQAWQPAPSVCNSTTALGLRAGCAGNRVRSFCSGEQYDPDLGLYYLRARYYNPATGRFLSRDPEDGKAKDPASLHKYLYAGGDPINRIDPQGREFVDEAMLDAQDVAEAKAVVTTAKTVLKVLDCVAAILGGVIAAHEGSVLAATAGGFGSGIACGLLLFPF
jgi:RHS repeat-associated protein